MLFLERFLVNLRHFLHTIGATDFPCCLSQRPRLIFALFFCDGGSCRWLCASTNWYNPLGTFFAVALSSSTPPSLISSINCSAWASSNWPIYMEFHQFIFFQHKLLFDLSTFLLQLVFNWFFVFLQSFIFCAISQLIWRSPWSSINPSSLFWISWIIAFLNSCHCFESWSCFESSFLGKGWIYFTPFFISFNTSRLIYNLGVLE